MNLTRLKRFDSAKHEQLEQLIAWCQLLGLEGKDLVSLGGHLDRVKKREESTANRQVVNNMGCMPIGKKDDSMQSRWKYKTMDAVYHFDTLGRHGSVEVLNTATNVKKHLPYHMGWEVGTMAWRTRTRYYVMLGVHAGEILLNF